MAQDHPTFVTVYESIGGWKACLMVWVEFDEPLGPYDGKVMTGMYEPWNTWYGQATKEEAIQDAREWAEAEEIELRL